MGQRPTVYDGDAAHEGSRGLYYAEIIRGVEVEVRQNNQAVVIIADMGSEPRADHIRSDNRAGMMAVTHHPLPRLPRRRRLRQRRDPLGLMYVLTGAGRRIPDDVAITGFDGTDLARYARPTLTTVKQLMSTLCFPA